MHGHRRHRDARRPSRRRRASRSSTTSRRPSSPRSIPPTRRHRRRGGGDRGGDRARRRGRRRGRGLPRTTRTPATCRPTRATRRPSSAAPMRRLLGGGAGCVRPRRLADRRARQPRRRATRARRTTWASPSPTSSRAAGSCPSPSRATPACSPRAAPGPGGPRVAMLWPQTYMNEAGRSVGPARGALHRRPRPRARPPRRDRPAVRRHPQPRRRRAGGPQRPEVAAAGARLGRLRPRAHRRRAAGLDRPGHRRRLRARQVAPARPTRSAALVDAAADAAERIVLGETAL